MENTIDNMSQDIDQDFVQKALSSSLLMQQHTAKEAVKREDVWKNAEQCPEVRRKWMEEHLKEQDQAMKDLHAQHFSSSVYKQ